MQTIEQVSAGGVVLRRGSSSSNELQGAIILTAPERRWQLPKGLIDPGETPEAAALREVREEAGVNCQVLAPIETVEYWFFASYDGTRRRYHKFVHFFLMKYVSGDVADHDSEVAEARWADIATAIEMLAFKDEKRVAARAAEIFKALDQIDSLP